MMRNQKTVEQSTVQTEPLTKWAKEPDILALKNDMMLAQASHDGKVSKVKNWLNLRNITGNVKPKEHANRSSVQPKLVRRQNEWRYAALSEPFLGSDKMFDVSPVTFEDKKSSVQNELLLNYQMRTKINAVKFIDKYVRNTVDEGTCYIKPGWQRETRKVMKDVPVYEYSLVQDPQMIEQLQQLIQLKTENPQEFSELEEELQESATYSEETGQPVLASQIGTEAVEVEEVVKNQPTLEFIHYENIYVDPSCGDDIEKANFMVISFETSKAKLKKDGRYKNLDKVNWGSNSPLHEPNHMTYGDPNLQFQDDLRKTVVAYEYWGFYDVLGDETLVPIVATWIGDTMIRMEENPYPDEKLPIVAVPYMPLTDDFTGEPDAELLGDNQAILGAITRGMVDLLGRSANGQTGHAKGMLDAVNKRRYDKGQDYEFNPTNTPNNGIHQHVYPEIPQSALTMLHLQNQEAEAISGVKSFSGGLSGEAYGDVAAGIRGMLDAAAKREMAILRRLAEGMEQIGRKMIAMNQTFLSDEEIIEVTNEQFVRISREDLKGEYNLKVDISTPEIEEAKAQDLGFMLQTLGNSLPFEITQIILVELSRLKGMPKLTHMLQNYKPEPDPVEEARKKLEVAKIEAEIAEIQADTMLKQAKARSEGGKADQADLDFVEQETGTKQARDIQKIESQAVSNQLHEVTKGLLQPKEKRPSNQDLTDALALHQMNAATV